MNINISLSELREFETRIIRWGTDRSFFFAEVIRKNPSASNAELKEFMHQWEMSHPIPKLIPSV